MPLKLACPWCRTVAVFPDAMRGQVAKCQACGKPFQLRTAPAAVTAAKPPPVPLPAPIPFKKEDAPRSPVRAGARPPAVPAPRRRPADDDDYPARPRKRRADAAGVSPGVWVCCGVGALAGVMILLIVLIRALNPADARPTPALAEQRVQAPAPNPEFQPPQQELPVVAPDPDEPPPGPLPAQLAREALAKVKKATVYVRAHVPGGLSQGTGFFAVEKGLVVTNAHVLNMHKNNRRPLRIEVVCDSGEPTERTVPALLLGAAQNPAPDLAVLRIQGADLPEPLTVRPAKHLTELQKVFVFGFPFGEQLGKNITISESSVASLRKQPGTDIIQKVQVNGGMQPGNSGGPVVDTRGHVVGVAVSIIQGTQINFAIPGEDVHGFLRDRGIVRR